MENKKQEGHFTAWNVGKVLTDKRGKQYVWFKSNQAITPTQYYKFQSIENGGGLDVYVYFKDNDPKQGMQRCTFNPVSAQQMREREEQAAKYTANKKANASAPNKGPTSSIEDIQF